MAGAEGEDITILVVCSANQCRSPLAAAVLRQRAEAAGLRVRVASAGASAMPGVPATPQTIEAGRRLGFDLRTHTSAVLDDDVIRDVDLVIGLERRHVQEVVLRDPAAFGKTFTLKELVRRGEAIGARAATEPVSDWLARVHAGRRPIDLLGSSPDDDVADPTGSNSVDHLTTAEELDTLGASVYALLY